MAKKPPAVPQPVEFPEQNFVYKRPQSMTEEQCGDLPCYRNPQGPATVSCWKMPWRQRLQILFTGKVWLYLVWPGHPPVLVTSEKPPMPKLETK